MRQSSALAAFAHIAWFKAFMGSGSRGFEAMNNHAVPHRDNRAARTPAVFTA